METKNIDIAIIGAGLTGLTTAFWLTRAGKQIQIIERQDRAGGQIRTFQENGFVYESGPNTGVVLITLFGLPIFTIKKWYSRAQQTCPTGMCK